MKNLSIIIFLLLALQVEAQYVSTLTPGPPPIHHFEVSEKSGCATFTVFPVTTFACGGGNSCSVRKGDGSPPVQFNEGDPVQYTTAGNFTLEIIFGTIGTSTLAVQVFANTQPSFEAYACTGDAVQIKVTDTNYDQYVIDYNDLSPIITVPRGSLEKDAHTFGSTGAQTVSVRGQNLFSAPNCTPATQTINVTPMLQPASISELAVLDASKIKLDFNTPPVSNQQSTLYKLDIAINNNTGFQAAPVPLIFNSPTATITGPRTEDYFFCFRLGTIDVCNSANNPISYSNTICSANFDLNMISNEAKLTWDTYSSAGSNVSGFSITKSIDEVPATPISKLASDPSHNDPTDCNKVYCYQLTTNYNNGSRSISLQKCQRSFSTVIPSTIEDISTIVTETGSTLAWIQDPLFVATEYKINKSISGSYSFLANVTTPTYNDPTYLTESSSCYKISYTDACENSSLLSVEACPIQLTGSLQPNNDVTLSWSAYTGWKNGVKNYVIQKFTSLGQLLETIDNGLATTYPDVAEDFTNQTYIYIITANANDAGVSESISNAFTITKDPYLTYPTAFSPRGNQPKNQIFKVFGQYVSSFELRIFNRWGQEMFYTNNFDIGWDGTYNGSLMPEGTYVFTAKITDQEGRTFDRSGTIVLLVKR